MGIFISIVCMVTAGLLYAWISAWTGGHPPEIRYAPVQASIKFKDRDVLKEVSLQQLLEEKCPSLHYKFKPVWWLPNGHLQTMYCLFGDFSQRDNMWYKRTYIKLAEGGTLGLDFAPLNHSELQDNTPVIIVQHGLTGGSYEPYVGAVLSRACASVESGGLGYRAVVINFRGCAGVPVTSPLLYSAGHTDDTRQALMYIAWKYPHAPLLGVGFSLGANVITRYLAEEGENSRLEAACILACPWDLKRNNEDMLHSFTGRYIYSKGLGGNLQRLLKRHFHSVTTDPNHYIAKAARIAIKLENPTLAEFDQAFTRVGGGPGPHFPFPNCDMYYAGCSTHDVLDKITVPLLSINAADDPVVHYVPMEGGGNGFVAMVLTAGGGHLGWFQLGKKGVDRWTTEPILEWLKTFGEGVESRSALTGGQMFADSDGWIREAGRDRYFGFIELAEMETLIDGNCGEAGTLQGLYRLG